MLIDSLGPTGNKILWGVLIGLALDFAEPFINGLASPFGGAQAAK